MPTIRTISTSLLLGMLLLPPHWCCAFPVVSPATALADETQAPRPAACCALHTPPVAAKAKRSCCVANATSSASGPMLGSDLAALDSAPLDAVPCPFCTPTIVATAQSSAPSVDHAWLPAIGTDVFQYMFEASATLVPYGESIPISGHPLARLCRWNC